MRLLARFTQGELRLGRIEAFSDGVFAIIVTLLVLDLKVPPLKDPASVAELGHALIEQLPRLLSWLITFWEWRATPTTAWCGSILFF